jgi:hypothetical protein
MSAGVEPSRGCRSLRLGPAARLLGPGTITAWLEVESSRAHRAVCFLRSVPEDARMAAEMAGTFVPAEVSETGARRKQGPTDTGVSGAQKPVPGGQLEMQRPAVRIAKAGRASGAVETIRPAHRADARCQFRVAADLRFADATVERGCRARRYANAFEVAILRSNQRILVVEFRGPTGNFQKARITKHGQRQWKRAAS